MHVTLGNIETTCEVPRVPLTINSPVFWSHQNSIFVIDYREIFHTQTIFLGRNLLINLFSSMFATHFSKCALTSFSASLIVFMMV